VSSTFGMAHTGLIKFFDPHKKFGYIYPDDSTGIRGELRFTDEGFHRGHDNMPVSFDMGSDSGRRKAVNVVLKGPPKEDSKEQPETFRTRSRSRPKKSQDKKPQDNKPPDKKPQVKAAPKSMKRKTDIIGVSRIGKILESPFLDLSVLVCFPEFWGLPLGGSRIGTILESSFLDLIVLVCFPEFWGLPLGVSRIGTILESPFLDLSVLVCFPEFWGLPLGGSRIGRLLESSFLDLNVLVCFPRVQ